MCDLTSGTCTCFAGFTNSNCDTYLTSPALETLVPPNEILVLSTTNKSFDQSILNLHASYPVVNNIFSWIRASDSVTSSFVMDALGNINVVSGALHFGSGSGGVTVGNGGVRVRNTCTIDSGGLSVTGGQSVSSKSLVVMGGMLITGGISIAVDPLGSYAGIQVKGGVTVNNRGLFITVSGLRKVIGGVTVQTGGLAISGGLSVSAGGMYLNKKGLMYVNSAGLQVTGGVTVAKGIVVDGGLHIKDSGIFDMLCGETSKFKLESSNSQEQQRIH